MLEDINNLKFKEISKHQQTNLQGGSRTFQVAPDGLTQDTVTCTPKGNSNDGPDDDWLLFKEEIASK